MLSWLIDVHCMISGLWIGQSGIVLEVAGALWIVISAFRSRRKMEGVLLGPGPGLVVDLKPIVETIKGQWGTELLGFALLATGLAFQFIGGLPVSCPTP